ncbi:MAG: hypothetical protein ACPGYF_05545 [Chitinophagales bacterium]
MDSKTKKSIHLALTLFLLGTSIITSYMWVFSNQEKQACNEECALLENDHEEVLEEFAKLDRQLEELDVSNDSLKKKKEEIQRQRDSLQQAYEIALDKGEVDAKTISSLRREIKSLENDYQVLQLEIKRLEGQVETLEGEVKVVSDINNVLQGEVNAANNKADSLQTQADKFESQRDKELSKLTIKNIEKRFLNKLGKEMKNDRKDVHTLIVEWEVEENDVREDGVVNFLIIVRDKRTNTVINQESSRPIEYSDNFPKTFTDGAFSGKLEQQFDVSSYDLKQDDIKVEIKVKEDL